MKIFEYKDYRLRESTLEDVGAITSIWLDGIMGQHLDDHSEEINEKEVLDKFTIQVLLQDSNFKFWVCLNDEDEVIAWQSILPLHASPLKSINTGFAQSSTYVKKEHRGKHLGELVLEFAFKYCAENTNINYAMAFVSPKNVPSLKMCANVGFIDFGPLPPSKDSDFPAFKVLFRPIQKS